MNINLRIGLVLGSVAVLPAVSQAIMFTNVKRDGFAVSATALGGPNLSNASGIAFNLSNLIAINGSSKNTVLTYTVTAGPGEVLSSYSLVPTGFVKNGSVGIFSTHNTTAIYSAISPTYLALGPSGSSLNGLTSYNVSVTVNTSSFAPIGGASIASIGNLALTYQATPVPEPASMGALALGVMGIVARRRQKRGN